MKLTTRLERIFIVVFVIDSIIKVLFHINGYRFLKDTSMVSSSENKVYTPTDKSVIHLLSNKAMVVDVILNVILIVLFLGIGDKDNGVSQITRAYLKLPFVVMFWCHYYEVKQKLN